jgi:hypothetical protein
MFIELTLSGNKMIMAIRVSTIRAFIQGRDPSQTEVVVDSFEQPFVCDICYSELKKQIEKMEMKQCKKSWF